MIRAMIIGTALETNVSMIPSQIHDSLLSNCSWNLRLDLSKEFKLDRCAIATAAICDLQDGFVFCMRGLAGRAS